VTIRGGGRLFKVERQELWCGGRVLSGVERQNYWYGSDMKLTTLFVKIRYSVTVLRITAIFALNDSIQNGRKINFEAEKWYGKQQLSIGHKKWAPSPMGSAAYEDDISLIFCRRGGAFVTTHSRLQRRDRNVSLTISTNPLVENAAKFTSEL